jgi:hypothetical protein
MQDIGTVQQDVAMAFGLQDPHTVPQHERDAPKMSL